MALVQPGGLEAAVQNGGVSFHDRLFVRLPGRGLARRLGRRCQQVELQLEAPGLLQTLVHSQPVSQGQGQAGLARPAAVDALATKQGAHGRVIGLGQPGRLEIQGQDKLFQKSAGQQFQAAGGVGYPSGLFLTGVDRNRHQRFQGAQLPLDLTAETGRPPADAEVPFGQVDHRHKSRRPG